jgi:hypothetical protein
MKALTIDPLWAWAIVAGIKTVENRSWRTHHRGPLAIHTARRTPAAREAKAREHLGAMGVVCPTRDELDEQGLRTRHRRSGRLCDARGPADDALRQRAILLVTDDSRRLDRPVPCRGREGLWKLSEVG